MLEAAAANMFSEIKITIKCNTKVKYSVSWCGAMIKDGHREETSKFVTLSGCTYIDEICFVSIKPNSIVCYAARDITETVT